MNSYSIVPTKTFVKNFAKLTAAEQEMVAKKMQILRDCPFYPSLRTRKMEGGYDYYESRVNKDIRLIWEFEDNKIILMLNVGHHDIYKGY